MYVAYILGGERWLEMFTCIIENVGQGNSFYANLVGTPAVQVFMTRRFFFLVSDQEIRGCTFVSLKLGGPEPIAACFRTTNNVHASSYMATRIGALVLGLFIIISVAVCEAGSCVISANYDSYGNDISYHEHTSPYQCATLCKALTSCQLFTFAPNGACWLKFAKSELKPFVERTTVITGGADCTSHFNPSL